MNPLARQVSIAAALSVLLFLSGCYTTESTRQTRAKAPPQFTVVDRSAGLELTPELLADLRLSVTRYLKDAGYDLQGDYTVKVNLNPEQPGDTGHWAVVRITSQPARTFTLLAAYPGADDFYPYDYYGYYNYSYPGFARYGYYDPLDFGWGYGGYYPPAHLTPPRIHPPGDKGDKHPPGTRTRWDGNRPDQNRPRPNERPPRSDGQRNWSRDRGDRQVPSGQASGGNYNPPPSSSYNPPSSYSAPAYSPPPASQPSPQGNSEGGRYRPQTEEK